MRIAFVTSSDSNTIEADVDRPYHDDAFARLGMTLAHCPWDRPTDWSDFDLLVMRSPWDYSVRFTEFSRWLESIADSAIVENPCPVIRWNLDKHYLGDLADLGVPIVPTCFAGDLAGLESALDVHGRGDVVLKPTVSAGSRDTGWFAANDPAARELGAGIFHAHGTVMVQPFIPSVRLQGEVSLVFFDGQLSHAFGKGPILARGGGLDGGIYREQITGHQPSPDELATAQRASAAVGAIARARGWLEPGSELLYERYDLVHLDDGTAVLLEAELFEPCFFVPVDPRAADRFAEACRRRVRT